MNPITLRTKILSCLCTTFFISFYSNAQDCDVSQDFMTDCETVFTLCQDKAVTDVNEPVKIFVSANDDVGILAQCDIQVIIDPKNGSVVKTDDCEMEYTPDLDFIGLDSFDYQFTYADTCNVEYECVDGLYIWNMKSYYYGQNNVSLDVYAGNKKFASVPVLNEGDFFDIQAGSLSPAENETWTFKFFDNTCLSSEANFCKVIDFNDLPAGTFVNGQYASEGITISAENNNGPDVALAFDSSNPTGGDPDLGTPNEDFGGPGVGSGGEAGEDGENSQSLGTVLIIAEDVDDSNNDNLVDDPDDDSSGGKLVMTFDEAVTVQSLKIIDLEENNDNLIMTYDPEGNLLTTYDLNGLGDNSVQTQIINEDNVGRMEVQLASSGAIDDLAFCRKADCLVNKIDVDTKCPAAQDVFGTEYDDTFRPISGCVGNTAAECGNIGLRQANEVTTAQDADTRVFVLIIEGGLLPIDFGNIYGRAIGEDNVIDWEVLAVVDEKVMTIQKSNDGIDFEDMESFTDLRADKYQSMDEEVESHVTYYRIQSISNNGDVSNSRAIAVTNYNVKDHSIHIFPNPASTEININADGIVSRVEIFDLRGQKVINTSIGNENGKVLLGSALEAGIYVTKVTMENGSVFTQKLSVLR